MPEPAGWTRLDALLDAALSCAPGERTRFLDQACAGDAPLRARMGELLDIAQADDPALRPGGGLEGALAREVLDDLGGPERHPALPPGTRLGRFEVRELLGSGGAGSVYRALDPTLGREVAIKALAGAFHDDPGALRRFEREARVLASVNHPNVAVIHGLEVMGGAPYLILELVEGETLDERLRRGPLSWRDAVEVARQIAEGLEEVHEKGVVHRDLKPANVKLTGTGRVKVLDFGLARARPPLGDDAGEDPLATATLPGTILGTVPYMSPEQARGEPVDARTDVWALGCLLYEMLTARRAFDGPTASDVLAAVLRHEVDWTALPRMPPQLRRLLERCLRRDVRQRWQNVGDVRLELAELPASAELAATALAPEDVPRRPPHRLVRSAGFIAAALAAVAAGTLLSDRLWPRPAVPAPRVLQLAVPTPVGIELFTDFAPPFALSPDGSTVVFIGVGADGARQLFVRSLEELEAQPLAGSDAAWQPFFSPDGRWVAFFRHGRLEKMALTGGAPVPLAELGGRPRGGWWGADGTIVVARSETSGLSRVSAEGGRLEELTRPDVARGERSHRWPQVLPGGDSVLFTVDHEGGRDGSTIEVLSLRTGERQVLVEGGTFARFLPDSHLVFARAGRLFAVPFDLQRKATGGRPTTVLDGVRFSSGSGSAHFAVASGTLLYVPGLPSSPERQLAWMDPSGRRTPSGGPARHFRELRLDPRGERIAVRIGPTDEAEVWIQDVESETPSQLTFGLRPWHPTWTRDGKNLTVGAEVGGAWRLLSVPVAGGAPVVLHESPHRLYPMDWSPDGRFLVYQELRPGSGWDLAVLEMDETGRPGTSRPWAATPANEARARFSADGRWLAYESDELDGLVHVYVAPFGRPGLRVTASRPAGRAPVWAGGRELLYWAPFPSEIRRVTWNERRGNFEVHADDPVWTPSRDGPRLPSPPFDFDASRKALLFLDDRRPESSPPPYRMTLFAGFGEEVRRRLSAAP